jgi:hypothetical protein
MTLIACGLLMITVVTFLVVDQRQAVAQTFWEMLRR